MLGSENAATLIGRVLMCLLFIIGGWGKLMAAAATQAMLAGHNLPMVQAAWGPRRCRRAGRRAGATLRPLYPPGWASAARCGAS